MVLTTGSTLSYRDFVVNRIFLILAFAAGTFAQCARVSGTVVDGATGKPLTLAHIRLSWPGIDPAYGAVSDERGAFTMSSVPVGEYQVTVEHVGFISGEAQRQLTIVNSQADISPVAIEMFPESVISGQITDMYGEPVAGVPVEAISVDSEMDAGTPETITDGAGRYRLRVLTGTYYVKTAVASSGVEGMDSVAKLRRGTYCPGVFAKAQAELVSVGIGDSILDANIRLQDLPGVGRVIIGHVSGLLEGGFVAVRFGEDEARLPGFRIIVPSPDGSFRFSEIPGTRFLVYAVNYSQGLRLRSQVEELSADDSAVSTVSLALNSPHDLAGSLTGTAGNELPSAARLTVCLVPGARLQDTGAQIACTKPRSDGDFVLPAIFPGKYRLTVESLPAHDYIRGLRYNQQDVSGEITVPVESKGRLSISVASDGAEIYGSVGPVNTSRSRTRVVLARDAMMTDVYEQVTVVKGGYLFSHIRPGKYHILAIQSAKHIQRPIGDEIDVAPGTRVGRDIQVK